MRLRGETITDVEPVVTGYCRRDIPALTEDATIADVLVLAEYSCALAGTAHRIAVVEAIEAATKTRPTRAARLTRVLFAEIERALARLWYLAECARAGGVQDAYAAALEQRETLFAALVAATGARVFWGIAVPGGIGRTIELADLSAAVKQVESDVAGWRDAISARGALGRAGAGVGVIAAEQVEALGLTGLAARGAIEMTDLRRERPYGGYKDLEDEISWPEPPERLAGDVSARLARAVDDLATSLSIAQASLNSLGDSVAEEGPATLSTPSGEGTARIAGPHGPVAASVTLSGADTIARMQLEIPGTALLAALRDLLVGARLGQAPLILASLDLCLECLDQ